MKILLYRLSKDWMIRTWILTLRQLIYPWKDGVTKINWKSVLPSLYVIHHSDKSHLLKSIKRWIKYDDGEKKKNQEISYILQGFFTPLLKGCCSVSEKEDDVGLSIEIFWRFLKDLFFNYFLFKVGLMKKNARLTFEQNLNSKWYHDNIVVTSFCSHLVSNCCFHVKYNVIYIILRVSYLQSFKISILKIFKFRKFKNMDLEVANWNFF